MAVRNLFDTDYLHTCPFRTSSIASRSCAGWFSHLSGMTNETVFAGGFDSLLTIKELAASLGINVQILYNLRFRGRGPHGIRIGRELKLRRSEI